MEPPMKRQRPEVPQFAFAEAMSAAEWERRAKAGMLDSLPSTSASPQASAPGAPSPRESDCVGAEEEAGAAGAAPPPGMHAFVVKKVGGDEAKAGKEFDGVYGFETGKKEEHAKRAIHVRMEPLKLGMPEFEGTLSEERQSLVIGCNRKLADVVVSDQAVSKKHCTLALVGIKGELALSVVDTSTNGTWLNGERLPEKEKRYRVKSGDRLQLKSADLEEDYGWRCEFGNTVAYFNRT